MARIDWQPLQAAPVNASFLDSANAGILGGVGAIGKALLGYGSDIRDQNTTDALAKIAALTNLEDLATGRTAIADAVAAQGRGVDQLKVLQALGAQQDTLTNRANASLNLQQNQLSYDEQQAQIADRGIINQALQLSAAGKTGEAQALLGQIHSNAMPLYNTLTDDKRYAAQQERQKVQDALQEKHWNQNYQLQLNSDKRADLSTAASLTGSLFPNAGTTEQKVVYDPTTGDFKYETVTNPTRIDAFSSLMGNLFSAESGPNQTHRTADGNLLKSPRGALGVAQIMPATAAKPGYGMKPIDLHNTTAEQQKAWATEYISRIGKAHGFSVPESVAAYNAGPGKVQKAVATAKEKGGSFLSYLPKETQNYVPQILGSNWQSMSGTKMKDFVQGSPAATTPSKTTVAKTNSVSQALGIPLNAKVVAAAQTEYKTALSKLGTVESGPESPMSGQKTLDQWLYDNRNAKNNSNSVTRLFNATDADDVYNIAQKNAEFKKLPTSKKLKVLDNMMSYTKANQGLFYKNPGDINEKINETILEDRKLAQANIDAKRTALLDSFVNKVLTDAGLPPSAIPKQSLYALFDPEWAKKKGKAIGKVDNPFHK
ncbi:lytic tail fiber protein [Acinetobacter phage Presley]|uniref:Lytic tail fiber n=1 Tax=Acinetobacter phage Presley TaxID=1406780 RepID=U5PZS4_9CAUD|nr:lytic tail fiber protein [Acinetobacter phage Presley]AGY48147.1 lytic tail fiber [Acinetobacter phage Presley]